MNTNQSGLFCRGVLASLAALGLCHQTAHAKPKIPEARVIDTYEYPDVDLPAPEAGAEAPAFGPGLAARYSPEDMARMEEISRQYRGTVIFLEGILRDIRRNSPRPEINPRIMITDNLRPNASAPSKDLILVSVGLLNVLSGVEPYNHDNQTEEAPVYLDLPLEDRHNALAFHIAHEYAHLLFQHPIIFAKREKDTRIFTDLVAAGFTGLAIANEVNGMTGGGMSSEISDAAKVLRSSAVATPWIEAEMRRYAFAPFRKDAEQLADFMAMDLLASPDDPEPKYDPSKGAQPLRSIYEEYDDSLKAKMKALSKEVEATLERSAERIANVAPAALLGGGNVGQASLNMLKLGAIEFGAKQLIGRLDKDKIHLYYRASKRVDAIDEYNALFYDAQVEAADAQLAGQFASFMDTYTQEHSAPAAADRAMALLGLGDVEGAEKALRSITDGSGANNTDYVSADGHVAFAQGNYIVAASHYERVRHKADVSVEVYSQLASSYLYSNQPEQALRTIDAGMERFSFEQFAFRKIGILLDLERNDDALGVNGRCQAVESKSVRKDCARAVKHLMEPDKPNLLGGIGKALEGIDDAL
ncbi:MAG: hypothetical protein WBG08_06110 [Litorimonas sp.]